jgi:hypothetical protein
MPIRCPVSAPRPGILGTVLAALATFAAPPLRAGTFYVSGTGSDGASGTSSAQAWKTLQHAADTVVAGDTVIALPGTYAGFILTRSGVPGAPITFTGNPGVDAPNPAVIVNANNDFTDDRINVEGASHVVIEGFTVLGPETDPYSNRALIRVVGTLPATPARFVTVRSNRCDRGGRWGIFASVADDLLVERNEASRSAQEHGIYLSNSGDRPVVRLNFIWGNSMNGLHMNGSSLGSDGIISNALIERNVITGNGSGTAWGSGGGSAINCDSVQSSTFRNNLLWDNHASGISLYHFDGGGASTGNLIHSNTIHNAADARWCLNIQQGSTGTTVRNNVLLNEHEQRGAIDISSDSLPGLSSDFGAVKDRFSIDGIFISLATWRATTGQDMASFIATPGQLVPGSAAGDYTLAPGCAAIDAGAPGLAPELDLPGLHRPAGAGYDIGAHESGACFGAATAWGAGLAGSGALVPKLAITGCPDPGGVGGLAVSNALGGGLTVLLVGSQAIALPKFGGVVLVDPAYLLPLPLSGPAGAPGAGVAIFAGPLPPVSTLLGLELRFQALVIDPVAVKGVALSPGLKWVMGGPDGGF